MNVPNIIVTLALSSYNAGDQNSRRVLCARRVLCCEVATTVRAPDVRRAFAQRCESFSVPASVLTNNGAIYNARGRGGRTYFESDLLELRVLCKHSTPDHPAFSSGAIEETWRLFRAARVAVEKVCDDVDIEYPSRHAFDLLVAYLGLPAETSRTGFVCSPKAGRFL